MLGCAGEWRAKLLQHVPANLKTCLVLWRMTGIGVDKVGKHTVVYTSTGTVGYYFTITSWAWDFCQS